jgi:energy-coupling factor transporter ATPase
MIFIKNLSYTYPAANKQAIQNIDLKIEEGEFVIITGPSGCGKTTLCRCLNGLIPHFYGGKLTGEIEVAKMNILDHQVNELAQHVGFIFQNPENQLFSLSVERDIAFGLENMALPVEEIRKRVDWALEITGISDLRDRSPNELSGGQQQKVAIACVLAMKPKIMVLDEPTSFLDPLSAKNLLEIIHKLHRELKLTILLVEHKLDLAAKYSDRLIVMNNGRIRLDGKPRDILSLTEARLIGIGSPKVTRLYQIILEEGLNLPFAPLTPEELAGQLRGILSN